MEPGASWESRPNKHPVVSRDKDGWGPLTYVYSWYLLCSTLGFLGIISHKYPLYRVYIGISHDGVRWWGYILDDGFKIPLGQSTVDSRVLPKLPWTQEGTPPLLVFFLAKKQHFWGAFVCCCKWGFFQVPKNWLTDTMIASLKEWEKHHSIRGFWRLQICPRKTFFGNKQSHRWYQAGSKYWWFPGCGGLIPTSLGGTGGTGRTGGFDGIFCQAMKLAQPDLESMIHEKCLGVFFLNIPPPKTTHD